MEPVKTRLEEIQEQVRLQEMQRSLAEEIQRQDRILIQLLEEQRRQESLALRLAEEERLKVKTLSPFFYERAMESIGATVRKEETRKRKERVRLGLRLTPAEIQEEKDDEEYEKLVLKSKRDYEEAMERQARQRWEYNNIGSM